MKSETYESVIYLIAELAGVSPSRITSSTRIREDLGVDGDDASEFMKAFAIRFQVDLAAFQLARHFGPEGSWSPIYALYCLFTGKGRTEPITVAQLVEAAERGIWTPTNQVLQPTPFGRA